MASACFLDAKDRAILYYLDKDARQSNASIAKKTKLSKEVINYRIKNLVKKGIVQNFYTIIDSSKLGSMIFRVFIRFQNVDMEKEKEILEYLKNFEAVGWVVSLEEMYDLAILIWAKNVFEFKETFDKISTKYGVFFRENFVTIVTHFHHYVNNYLFGTADLTERTVGGKFEKVALDETDLQILSLLSKDARIPLLNISKKLDVSPNTVKQRIRKMREKGVIVGFKAKINSGLLGYQHYKIFLQLSDVNPQVKLQLREYLKLNNNVTFVTEAVGRADMEFEIQVKNNTELRNNLEALRQCFGGLIRGSQTTLINQKYLVDYFPSYMRL